MAYRESGRATPIGLAYWPRGRPSASRIVLLIVVGAVGIFLAELLLGHKGALTAAALASACSLICLVAVVIVQRVRSGGTCVRVIVDHDTRRLRVAFPDEIRDLSFDEVLGVEVEADGPGRRRARLSLRSGEHLPLSPTFDGGDHHEAFAAALEEALLQDEPERRLPPTES